MTQSASESLVAVLIRIGLLLALAILLMAENAQAQSAAARFSAVSPVNHQYGKNTLKPGMGVAGAASICSGSVPTG